MRALVLLVLCGCPKSTEPVPDTAVSVPASATATVADAAAAPATASAPASATATVAVSVTASAPTPTSFPPAVTSCASDADCTLVHVDTSCCPQCAGKVGNRAWSARVDAFCATQKVKCRPMACSYLEAIPHCKAGNCS